MAKNIVQKSKIGVLGGGQLARMLCQQGQKWGLEVHVLSENSNDPAALSTPFWSKGSINQRHSIQKFSEKVDVLTFESEFADVKKIRPFLKNTKAKVFPSLQNISLLQDRLSQKQVLSKHRLTTSPFIHSAVTDSYLKFFSEHGPFVAKKRFNGYDGYGTFIIKNKKQLHQFLKQNEKQLNDFIAEKYIPFHRELSLVLGRSKNGSLRTYPLVESFQKEAKCFWVKGPMQLKALSPLKLKIRKFLDQINYVGVIAFELFEYQGQLLINEVAPRVHNTGHHSLDSCNIDQFSLHLFCLLGLEIPPLKARTPGFAMVNLIGSQTRQPRLSLCNHSILHWYQKQQNRPGRKMGHINSVASSPDLALKQGLKDLKGFRL